MKRNLLLGFVVAAVLSCSGRMILMAAHSNSTEKTRLPRTRFLTARHPHSLQPAHSLRYWKGTQGLRAETIPCG